MLCKKCGQKLPDDAVYCLRCGKKQIRTAAPKRRKRPNGSGTVIKRGRTYTAIKRVCSHKQVIASFSRGGFATRQAAEAYLATMDTTRVEQHTMKFCEAWRLLQETKKYQSLSKNKQSHYRTAYKRLAPVEMRIIGSVTFKELQQLVDAAPGDFYAHRDIKTLLGRLYEVAITNEALDPGQDKTDLLELPPIPESERDAFTVEEVHKMWNAYHAGSLMAQYALILCYTGMRPGEFFQIDVAQVDLQAQRMVGGIKTAAGKNREIPIASSILPLVQDALAHARYGLSSMRIEDFYDTWTAQEPCWGIRPHMTAHSGRHTLATAMETAEISPVIKKLVLGHAIKDITEHYSRHISFSDKLAAVEKATADFAPV